MITLQLVINSIKILCTNTAWQRRKLGKSLQDWSTISIQVCEINSVLLISSFLRCKFCFHVGKRVTSATVNESGCFITKLRKLSCLNNTFLVVRRNK